MDFVLLITLLLVFMFAGLGWVIWKTYPSGSLREMNAGARLFQEKRYAEAESRFQQLLTQRLPPSIEADTRRRLADTLDVLGKSEEAALERERAGTVAMNTKHNPMALATQGDLLKRQHRYNEACELFQRALSMMPPVASPGRAQIMAKLAMAHHEAGRSSETLKWAKTSLVNNPNQDIRILMEKMAGIASADQGDLESAEIHYLRALELAEAAAKPDKVASVLALLANVQAKHGQYEAAIPAARRSWELTPTASRVALAVEAECLRDMGRFDEARAVMARWADGPRHDQPHIERKSQALGSLGIAWIETRAEQPEAAWKHLEAAREGLQAVTNSTTWPPPPGGSEEKLILWCDATAANILSQQGNAADAHRLRDSVESRLTPFAGDYATLRGVYRHLARAALRTGELAECRRYCLLNLDCRPTPGGLPTIHYLLGEVALRLAETDAARAAFRQAVAPGIDSLEARKAQARLNEMSG